MQTSLPQERLPPPLGQSVPDPTARVLRRLHRLLVLEEAAMEAHIRMCVLLSAVTKTWHSGLL